MQIPRTDSEVDEVASALLAAGDVQGLIDYSEFLSANGLELDATLVASMVESARSKRLRR